MTVRGMTDGRGGGIDCRGMRSRAMCFLLVDERTALIIQAHH